jgi:hypothetical protein
MVEKGVVETDDQGHYRLKRPGQSGDRKRTWVSPQVKRILERSSADFTHVLKVEEEEEDLL